MRNSMEKTAKLTPKTTGMVTTSRVDMYRVTDSL
jgi:hypothetical protein